MTEDDVAARVRRLELIELAKAATVEYGRACDRKDVAALRTDIFSDDVVLHLSGRDVHGPDDVAAFYTGAFAAEPGTRRHFVTNQLATVDEAGRVVVDSYFLFLSADATSVIGWGAYRDVVVVVGDDSTARIADKTIVIDVHTDVTKGWAMEPAT